MSHTFMYSIVKILRLRAELIRESSPFVSASILVAYARNLLDVERILEIIVSVAEMNNMTGLAEAAARALTEASKSWMAIMKRARELAANAETMEELQNLRRVAELYRRAGHGGPPLRKLQSIIEERAKTLHSAQSIRR